VADFIIIYNMFLAFSVDADDDDDADSPRCCWPKVVQPGCERQSP